MTAVTTRALGALLVVIADHAAGHGHITLPPSTRHGGSWRSGNSCINSSCAWFSNNVKVPGAATLPNGMRTVQPNVSGQPEDVYVWSPWRAPGSAPVLGSGCGVGGGSKEPYLNGGECASCPQGLDGKLLPPVGRPQEWKRGETADVAWAIAANHGGGYSYRLCPADPAGDINEACFQRHQLDFAGTTSDILYANGTRVEIPRSTTRTGTYPPGSQWARNPIPGCYLCDAYQACGATLAPVSGIPPEDPCTACTEGMCAKCNATFDDKCNWVHKGSKGTCKSPPDVCKGMSTFPPFWGGALVLGPSLVLPSPLAVRALGGTFFLSIVLPGWCSLSDVIPEQHLQARRWKLCARRRKTRRAASVNG